MVRRIDHVRDSPDDDPRPPRTAAPVVLSADDLAAGQAVQEAADGQDRGTRREAPEEVPAEGLRPDGVGDRPDWWTPEHEQAALAGVHDGIQARHGHTDVDRLRVAKRFYEATANGIATSLGAWAGRGDWAHSSDTFRSQQGQQALVELDKLIGRLTAYREQLHNELVINEQGQS